MPVEELTNREIYIMFDDFKSSNSKEHKDIMDKINCVESNFETKFEKHSNQISSLQKAKFTFQGAIAVISLIVGGFILPLLIQWIEKIL